MSKRVAAWWVRGTTSCNDNPASVFDVTVDKPLPPVAVAIELVSDGAPPAVPANVEFVKVGAPPELVTDGDVSLAAPPAEAGAAPEASVDGDVELAATWVPLVTVPPLAGSVEG